MSITFLSYSKIDTFDQCPRAYKYKYIDYLEAEFTPDYFTLGHLVHESIARAERERIVGYELKPRMEVTQETHDMLKSFNDILWALDERREDDAAKMLEEAKMTLFMR